MVGGGFVAGSIISKLIMDTSKWDKSTRDVVSKTGQLGQKLGRFGTALSTKVTAPLALAGVAAVKVAADFEQKLVNAFSVTGSSSDAVKQQMSDLAREMGATTVFAATEAADAMYYMASAGWKADDMAAALKDTLDLAAATQTDLAFTTSTVISTLNQFGLSSAEAGRITNVYAAAISNSQATMDRLGTSMMYVGPVMNSLGKNVEESTSLLMGLYNAGFDASTAGTALRMGLTKLMIPTKQSSQALEKLGLTFEQVNPETHKIADVIQLLGERGATTKDIMMLFGVRAGPAFAALINQGGDALKNYEKQITGTNRAAEMAEMQIDTFKGSMKLLTSALSEAGISIGDMLAPAIRSIAEGITGLITKFNELGPQTRGFIVTLAGIAAAMGPLALILGKVLLLISKIKTALIASKAAFMISAAGVGILVAALGALVVGYMKVAQARDKAIESSKRELEQESKLARKVTEATKAVGIHGQALHELYKKYNYQASAMALAIKRGKEGKELQEALAKVSEKHAEAIEKQKAAMDESIPTVGDLTAEFNKLEGAEGESKKAAEEWAEFLKSVGIVTVQQKADRVADLQGKLERLHAMYKAGKINMKEYTEGVKKVNTEITDLSTTLTTTALPAASLTAGQIAAVFETASGEMQQHTQDFTEHLRTESVNVINIGQEMSDTFAMSFRSNLEGLILGTTSWKDAVVGIFGDLKAKFASIVADMATNWIMGFAQKLITGTLESTTSVASQLTSTAGNILKQVGSWSPGGIIGSVISGAVSGIFGSIFGKKAAGFDKHDSGNLQELRDIARNHRDLMRIDFTDMMHILTNHAIAIREFTGERIPLKQDHTNRILGKHTDILKEIAKAAGKVADKIKTAQGGAVFKETELAIMHGTPSEPEIAAPAPMLERFVAVKGKSNVTSNSLFNVEIEVKDQLDPNKAQEITREQILPQILRAVEVNDRQFRTRLEEILKIRI